MPPAAERPATLAEAHHELSAAADTIGRLAESGPEPWRVRSTRVADDA